MIYKICVTLHWNSPIVFPQPDDVHGHEARVFVDAVITRLEAVTGDGTLTAQLVLAVQLRRQDRLTQLHASVLQHACAVMPFTITLKALLVLNQLQKDRDSENLINSMHMFFTFYV